VKRAIDVMGAIALLVLAGPLLALITLVGRVTMGAPVLYRQVRAGRHGQLFTLIKFRTMRPNALGEDALASDGVRLTALGRFLRATSLDELPQLWNVLRGDMALVGPRPLLPEYLPRYSPEQSRRHEARPGLTGLAQIRGRNGLSWEEKFALDVWYVDHWSLGLDLSILWRTLVSVARREGIAASGHVTMPEFFGSGPIEGSR
jgi:lipopolysaccharide/colanic/teichoic acid biosynthesis glycosyltransferase